MPIASTPAQYILILIDMVERQGCDREQLLAGTSSGEVRIAGIGARIADADFNQLVANAQALTGDPALGLKLGLRLNLSAHAVLGQAFMTCRDLGAGLELLLKYHHLLASGLHLEFETVGEQCVLTTDQPPVIWPSSLVTNLSTAHHQHPARAAEQPGPDRAHGSTLPGAGPLGLLL